ncbi:MAG TPA: hypothetical protein VMW27_12805 [Thermoanaerobaculia bacterium]|nr:hypothetical protein [Thermoanaerobaculia bacterium]
MLDKPLRRRIVVFVLAVTVAVPWASAAGLQPVEAAPVSLDLVGQLWIALARIWNKTGCDIDPSGLCAPAPENRSTQKEGCQIDPDGLCVSAPEPANETDEGCDIDPSGGDTGCHIDPNGRP